MALGAMEAFAARGLAPGHAFGIVGLNWSGEAVEAVRDGRMILTDGGHFLAGAWAMVLLRDYHDGCDTGAGAPRQIFPMAAIDRSNADALAAMLVAGDFSRIDFSRFTSCLRSDHRRPDFSMPRILEAMRSEPR
jgi:ABC-type sugar transport system substrate-binding protein